MDGFKKMTKEAPRPETDPRLKEKFKEILYFGVDVAANRMAPADPVGERLKRLMKTIDDINSRIDRLLGNY